MSIPLLNLPLSFTHFLISLLNINSYLHSKNKSFYALQAPQFAGGFTSVIYDSNPLPQLFWENVVLVGDAAHPTTAHAARSTNMAILDAEVLGICLRKWGLKNLPMAVEEYQTIQHPVVSKQVIQSREMGRLKLGLPLSDGKAVDLNVATPGECYRLLHKSIDFYEKVPTTS